MMSDDFNVFWRNNERASALFYDLLARAERGAYDDDFLAQLAAYREAEPTSERADIFAAKYLLHHGDAENAAVCAERAYRKRPVNYEVWLLLADLYARLNRPIDALIMQGYAYGLYGAPQFSFHLDEDQLREGLGRLSIALGMGKGAPLAKVRAVIREQGLQFSTDLFIGEPLPLTMPPHYSRFWAASYTDYYLSDQGIMLDHNRHTDAFSTYGYRAASFQLQQAEEVRGPSEIQIPAETTAIVPIAGTSHLQKLTITNAGASHPLYLGKWAFSLFRLEGSAHITPADDRPYAIGTPIPLGHSPARRKLVLNILVDGLSWGVIRTCFAECMPNTARFFARGTIFDQHFSVSEFTYPSLPTIETGRYPAHTQVFNENDSHELPLDIKTLSESMADLGYYTAAPLGAADCIYSGAMRGYRTLNAEPWTLSSADLAERTIRQIEAFNETDQFLYLHTTDVHPWNPKGFKFYPSTETHLPLTQRVFEVDENVTSVHLAQLPVYQDHFWRSLSCVDRHLGYLFSYIEAHFDERDILVSLYSDHGNSVFTMPMNGSADVIAENATHAVWMMRGAGVPEGHIVSELTSSADLYPTLGTLCTFPVADDIDGNLPAVFGGKGRDAVYSMSMFPGQTYKLAVRTHDHALRLETQEKVDEDGTVDFADARVGIYPRGHELDENYVVDSAELQAFFCPRARDFVREIANNGEFWPAMRAARPTWFGGQP